MAELVGARQVDKAIELKAALLEELKQIESLDKTGRITKMIKLAGMRNCVTTEKIRRGFDTNEE